KGRCLGSREHHSRVQGQGVAEQPAAPAASEMTTSFAYGQRRDSGSTLRVRLGRRLKAARQLTRLSLKDVSERMGRSETYYGMIERGQRRPSQGVLLRICEILDMPPADRDAVFGLFRDSYVADSLRGFEEPDVSLGVREP